LLDPTVSETARAGATALMRCGRPRPENRRSRPASRALNAVVVVPIEICPVVHARREYLVDRRPLAIEGRNRSNYEGEMRQVRVKCVRLPERELPLGMPPLRYRPVTNRAIEAAVMCPPRCDRNKGAE
jgi:hypothetical protein